nr:phage terminase large subunit family protein [Desulfovibrio sp.]
AVAPEDPGAFHLHTNEGGILEQYAREMCAEVWDDEKMAWVNPSGKPNHFWDCETMVDALAYILNVRHMARPEEARAPRPRREVQRPLSISDRLANFRR